MRRAYFGSVWKKVGQAIADYDLISDGDRIGVGISGGKDSLVLLWVLSGLRDFAPVTFDVSGLMVKMGWEADVTPIAQFCRSLDIEFHTRDTNIGPLVFEQRRESNPCSLCSHLRRGALNALANEHECNKVALAHHLDDAIETLLLSVFFEGKIDVFKPNTRLQKVGLSVIRPFVYVEERSIAEVAKDLHFPVLSEACPASGNTRRAQMKSLISALSEHNPGIRNRAKSALRGLWSDSLVKDPPQ